MKIRNLRFLDFDSSFLDFDRSKSEISKYFVQLDVKKSDPSRAENRVLESFQLCREFKKIHILRFLNLRFWDFEISDLEISKSENLITKSEILRFRNLDFEQG